MRRSPAGGRWPGLLLLLLLLLLVVRPAILSAQLPPDATWRAFETPNFRVTYMEGLEAMARGAASRAEAAHAVLSTEVVRPPRGRIELVIADNVDFTNGYATPLPTNRIVVYAHPPVDSPELAFTPDWLHLVVLHELVHIFHLDHTAGVWERLRRVFGRNALLFPQAQVPSWVIEGLATYYESRLTPGGRVEGTLLEMAIRTAILEGTFFPIDRASGDPARWPGGSSRYVYGAMFMDFLARRHGPERVPEFVSRYGRQLTPFQLDAAAARSFGETFTRAWSAWEDSLRVQHAATAAAVTAAGTTEPEILTPEGRVAAFPRFSPAGDAIAYSAATGLDRAATRLILPDGSLRTLHERTTLGPVSWLRDGSGLLLAQLDFSDPYRIHSDVYRSPSSGGLERVTRAARILEPDVHPDGTRAVAVQGGGGTSSLVVVELASGAVRTIMPPEPGVSWALPRWSPDGGSIAVTRWAPGWLYDVVVLDSAGAVIREPVRDAAIDASPAWSPEGRYLLFSSDRTGIPNLFAYDLDADRLYQVTNVLTGALQPDVSPDGGWIAFSYYRGDGYHIARIPFRPASWRPAGPLTGPAVALDRGGEFPAVVGETRPYSPWPSVAPAGWTLLADGGEELGPGIGAAVAGADVVERHVWAGWGTVRPSGGRFEGGAEYRYRGLGIPVLELALEQDWRVAQAARDSVPSAVLRRDRDIGAAARWTRRRWSSSGWLTAGGGLSATGFSWDEPERVPGRGLRRYPWDARARLELGYASARGTALSLGPQAGTVVSAALEGHRYTAPLDAESGRRGYARLTGRARSFHALPLPGFARHVLATRLDVGAETGSISPGFSAGGASGGSLPGGVGVGLLGGGVRFPIRGFPQGAQRGDRAFSATAEYRFPVALVERGYRLLPVFLDRVWGDLFLDVGAAWCGARCDRRFGGAATRARPLSSLGAETMVDLRLGYHVAVPLRAGVALPISGDRPERPVAYLRVGRSF